jgi:hypothetical protein
LAPTCWASSGSPVCSQASRAGGAPRGRARRSPRRRRASGCNAPHPNAGPRRPGRPGRDHPAEGTEEPVDISADASSVCGDAGGVDEHSRGATGGHEATPKEVVIQTTGKTTPECIAACDRDTVIVERFATHRRRIGFTQRDALSSAEVDTIPQGLAAVRRDPTPLLTWYDDAPATAPSCPAPPWTTGCPRPPTCLSTAGAARRHGGGAPAAALADRGDRSGRGGAAGRRPRRPPQPVECLFTTPDACRGRGRWPPSTGTRRACYRWPRRCARCRRLRRLRVEVAPSATASSRAAGDRPDPALPAGRVSHAAVCEAAAARRRAGHRPATGCWSTRAPTPTRRTGCSHRSSPARPWCSAPTRPGQQRSRPSREGHGHADLTDRSEASCSNAVSDSGLASAPRAGPGRPGCR